MGDWLNRAFQVSPDVEYDVLFAQLGMACLLGCVVAGIYWWTRRHEESYTPSFLATLILLSILIAMVTKVIGNSTARAFSLVGALAIVRFRTVVEDTRDTAFVIFAVIVGMAVGANRVEVALAGLVVVGVAALAARPRRQGRAFESWSLSLRVGVGSSPDELVGATFAKYLVEVHLLGTATGRQGAALDLTYRVRLRPGRTATELIAELNQLPGVQNAEVRRL